MLFPYVGVARKKGRSVNTCPDGLKHFFPCQNGQFFLRGGQNACQDGLFTLQLILPHGNNTFKKGASLSLVDIRAAVQ